jgi:SAM-dependent methyltransferase
MSTADRDETDRLAESEDQNLFFAQSRNSTDELVASFYRKFPYPWRPRSFHYLLDPNFGVVMLNQSIGDFNNYTVPRRAKVWVAGCGTNQAIITALRFPESEVLGSDLSAESLKICEINAKEIGVTNLTLKNESINDIPYKEEFDHIISTGVIHHNADPRLALSKLKEALKPEGILELMVYNRYHRIVTSVFQRAIRLLSGNREYVDFDADLLMAKRLVNNFPANNLVAACLAQVKDKQETANADNLINPVEHSYTVESLEQMAQSCGMQILVPCINVYDQINEAFSWNLKFGDAELQRAYDELPDLSRWQVTNLLMFEQSPMLWFYLQRKDSGRERKAEKEICERFLDTKFARASTIQKTFTLKGDGFYKLSPHSVPYPSNTSDPIVAKIIGMADDRTCMREIFQQLEIEQEFQTVNELRMKLTTSAFPYLKAV